MPPRLTATMMLVLLSSAAAAQLSPAAKMSQVAANQVGILEYCHDHGQASDAALAAEQEAFAGAPATSLSTRDSQALGRKGFSVSPDGEQISIAAWAVQEKMTVAALCADLADSSLAFQAAVRKERDRMAGERAAK